VIELADHAEGVLLPVRAKPGAKKNGVQGERDGALVVAVNAPPEDGRANAALVEVLHDALGLKRSQIELVSGHKARDKRFLLRGVTRAEVTAKLAEWAD
jgi:uncharacterized protein (TIGR00251 family)